MSVTPFRKMRDPKYRLEMENRLRDPHIIPITTLVDRLRGQAGRGWMPYVAPSYGGGRAEALYIFRDPGPKTQLGSGSGMLCHENDDPSAQLFAELLEAANISSEHVMTWNAYPWYINKQPTTSQIVDALPALRELLGLLPCLQVVVPSGKTAQESWRRFKARHPDIANRYIAIDSLHTSRLGIIGGGKHARSTGIQMAQNDYGMVSELIKAGRKK